MRYLILTFLAAAMTCGPALAEEKTLSNSVLNDKGYQRLEGDSQFRLGCRYIVRSSNRTTVYRPTVVRGRAISFSHAGIAYRVGADDKTRLFGTDGSESTVTTWRTCAVL